LEILKLDALHYLFNYKKQASLFIYFSILLISGSCLYAGKKPERRTDLHMPGLWECDVQDAGVPPQVP
jgi:hypothetical protein